MAIYESYAPLYDGSYAGEINLPEDATSVSISLTDADLDLLADLLKPRLSEPVPLRMGGRGIIHGTTSSGWVPTFSSNVSRWRDPPKSPHAPNASPAPRGGWGLVISSRIEGRPSAPFCTLTFSQPYLTVLPAPARRAM